MNRHAYFRQQEKNALMHHGVKGQKWGVRRYQNPDGSYTEEGKERRITGNNFVKKYNNFAKKYSKPSAWKNPKELVKDATAIIKKDDKNSKSLEEYTKQFNESPSYGVATIYTKPRTDSRPQIIFSAKDDYEKKWKAEAAKAIDDNYEYLKKEWDNAIIKSGIMDRYEINKKDQETLLNSQDSIAINAIDGEHYAYIGYYKHGINPGNNSLNIDYDLKNRKIKSVMFDS